MPASRRLFVSGEIVQQIVAPQLLVKNLQLILYEG